MTGASKRSKTRSSAGLRYDARRAPDAAEWLQADEGARVRAVHAHHLTAPLPHPLPPSPEAHSTIHTVIETQLAENDPPETRRALGRLLSEGLGRHEAIHALGTVFAAAVWDASAGAEAKALDVEGYKRALDTLDVGRWRELVGDESAALPGKTTGRKRPRRKR